MGSRKRGHSTPRFRVGDTVLYLADHQMTLARDVVVQANTPTPCVILDRREVTWGDDTWAWCYKVRFLIANWPHGHETYDENLRPDTAVDRLATLARRKRR